MDTLTGGVLTGYQAGEAHERAGGGEAAPVTDLTGDGQCGQLGDAPVGAQPGHRIGERAVGVPVGQVGLHRGQFGIAGDQHRPVVGVGRAQCRLVEALPKQPLLVFDRPLLPVAPDPVVAQQELRQPVPRAGPVGDHVRAGPAQIPHRLLGPGGHPDRHQLPGPVQPGQPTAVPRVGLDPIPRRAGHQRRRDHVTGHPHRGQQPVQAEPGRSGLVAHPQLATVAEPVDQPADRPLIVEDLLRVRGHLIRTQNPHQDCVFTRVQPEVDRTGRQSDTGHNGRLLPVVAPSTQRG